MKQIDIVEAPYRKKEIPAFRPGDSVAVHVKVVEGEKERLQIFKGIVIGRRGSGISETLTVRKISHNIGVERIFPIHSPTVDRIEVIKTGKVRRAKLYYMRERTGKAATKIKERIKSVAKPGTTTIKEKANSKKTEVSKNKTDMASDKKVVDTVEKASDSSKEEKKEVT